MTQLFISYSRKDIDFVRQLAGDLEKAGYSVWWDLTDLRGGDDWVRLIPEAIDQSSSDESTRDRTRQNEELLTVSVTW